MIKLYNQKDSPLRVNIDLVNEYKRQADIYLLDMRRELTRALVDYIAFRDLQLVNNSFFDIVDKLLNQEFTCLSELRDSNQKLVVTLETFLKVCKQSVEVNIYAPINISARKFILTVHKLIQIIESINEEN